MAWIAFHWTLAGPGQTTPAASTLAVIGGPAIGSFPIGGSMEPLTPGVFVVLDGQLLGRRIRAETLEVTLALDGSRRLELVYWAPAGGEHLVTGQRILLREDTVNVFRGTIHSADAVEVPGTVVMRTRVQAVDNAAILERRVLTQADTFTSELAGTIVKELVEDYLAGEAVTVQSVLDGPTLDSFTSRAFDTVADALRQLGDLTGFIWFVDANGDLHFEPQATTMAPFAIGVGGLSPLQETVRVSITRERYRNRQTVRYGPDTDLVVTVDNTAEQAARRALEGGTGIYHAVRDERDIETAGEATALAEALLRRYGVIPKRIDFALRTRGLRPGQTVSIELPEYALDEDFLVEEVVMMDEGGTRRKYEITAVTGEHQDEDSLAFWRATVAR